MSTDLVDWVIEESEWDNRIYVNGNLFTLKRRFPPYILKEVEGIIPKSFYTVDEFKIFNRTLNEDEFNHIVMVGLRNNSIPFDGKDDYIDVSNEKDINFNEHITYDLDFIRNPIVTLLESEVREKYESTKHQDSKCFNGELVPWRASSILKSDKSKPIISVTSPSGHKVVIDFQNIKLKVDNINYINYFVPFVMSKEEIESDYTLKERGITMRWARKDACNLEFKIRTDFIVIDWKNDTYWINGIKNYVGDE